MKLPLAYLVMISLTLLSTSSVLSAPAPPPNELDEAAEALLGLADERRATQTATNARTQPPLRQPRQREGFTERRQPPAHRASSLPGARRVQALDADDQYFYQVIRQTHHE